MQRIRGIDGLRAIAVLMVLLSHLFFPYFEYVFGHVHETFGGHGVSIFFVISGFLITSILLKDRADPRPTRFVFLRFYLRRALRILPAYYAVIFLGCVMSAPGFRGSVGWHLSYATNVLVAHQNAWSGEAGHFWSLAVEEQFYLACPLLMLCLPKRFLLGSICLFIGIGAVSGVVLSRMGASSLQIYVLPFPHFDELGLGALIGYLYTLHPEMLRRSIPSRAAVFGFFCACLILYVTFDHLHLWWLRYFVDKHVTDLLAACVILHCAFAANSSLLVRSLELFPLKYLGRISYGVYLINPLVPAMFVHTRFANQAQHSILGFSIYVLTTVGIAAASWTFFETRILRLKSVVDQFIDRRASSEPEGFAPEKV